MRKVTNMASLAIIYRQKKPEEIFLEVKDDKHPIKLARRRLNPIGGTWIGEAARFDTKPLGTLWRKIKEELSFERAIKTTLELKLLGLVDTEVLLPTKISSAEITSQDWKELKKLKEEICERCMPFGAFLHSISKRALDSADPNNWRDGFAAFVNYYVSGLDEKFWKILERLQNKFHNLSKNSITLITSLPQVLATGTNFAFGHDYVFRKFFSQMGFPEARHLPSIAGIEVTPAARMFDTYEEYLRVLDVDKKPPPIQL